MIRPDEVSVPVTTVLSERLISPDEESMTIFPVVAPPIVRV